MRKLNPQQELFVEAFCSSPTFNATQAAKDAGYSETSAHIRGPKLLQNPRVQKAIDKRLEKRKTAFWLKENTVLEKLWEEATRTAGNASHAARINALVWLGKHIGMWREKVEETEEAKITYNVINYSDGGELKGKVNKLVEENKEEVEENKNKELPEGVVLLNYKNEA